METVIGLATLFVSLVAAGGAAAAWIVRRLDRRFSAIDRRFDEAREERNQLRAELAQLQVELANRVSRVEGLVEGMWKALALRLGSEPPPDSGH